MKYHIKECAKVLGAKSPVFRQYFLEEFHCESDETTVVSCEKCRTQLSMPKVKVVKKNRTKIMWISCAKCGQKLQKIKKSSAHVQKTAQKIAAVASVNIVNAKPLVVDDVAEAAGKKQNKKKKKRSKKDPNQGLLIPTQILMVKNSSNNTKKKKPLDKNKLLKIMDHHNAATNNRSNKDKLSLFLE